LFDELKGWDCRNGNSPTILSPFHPLFDDEFRIRAKVFTILNITKNNYVIISGQRVRRGKERVKLRTRFS